MRDADGASPRRPRRSPGELLRWLVLGLAALAVLVLVLQNQDPVQTRFIGWSVEMPRFLLLAVVYGLGIATGWILGWRRRRS